MSDSRAVVVAADHPTLARDFILLRVLTRCKLERGAVESTLDATNLAYAASGLPLAELAARVENLAEELQGMTPEVALCSACRGIVPCFQGLLQS